MSMGSQGMPLPSSMGAGPMGSMSGVAGPSPVIYSGPPTSSGYGGRGGMPDGRGGMADGRGGMPDVRGGMPDVRGGIPDGRGGMSGGPPMQDSSKVIEWGTPDGRGGMPDGRGGMADVRGGMPDVRSGMPDVRGGMPDVRGGMPDGRGGISDMLIAQMSSARSFDTILIRNLPLDLNGEVLREGFSHCGDIQNAAMTEGGSGLIRFGNERDAERAVSMMHKQTVAGRVIDVRPY